MERYLDEDILKSLRAKGLLTKNEVALEIGDLLIAEDVINKKRRIIEKNDNSMHENSKRLLKG